MLVPQHHPRLVLKELLQLRVLLEHEVRLLGRKQVKRPERQKGFAKAGGRIEGHMVTSKLMEESKLI